MEVGKRKIQIVIQYKVELTKQAEKSFSQIIKFHPKIGQRLSMVIDRLSQEPKIGVPLKGELKGLWKYRVGNYRIIYQIKRSKLIITVIDIGHRREVYR